jgi:hypothetical protein
MMILRGEAVPGEAGTNPPASIAPESRLSGAATRIDKAELRVGSGCFFCPEQWRLQHGLGNSSTNTALLAHGAALHRKTAAVEVWSRHALRLAFVLVVLAALLVLRALFLRG